MLVQANGAAHHTWVVIEMAVPIRVTEYDVGRAIGTVLIGLTEEAAEMRLDPQCIEVVSARFEYPGARGTPAGVQCSLVDIVCSQPVEAAVSIPEINVIGIR